MGAMKVEEINGDSISGREVSKCKVLEMGACLLHPRDG